MLAPVIKSIELFSSRIFLTSKHIAQLKIKTDNGVNALILALRCI